jgi:hypothetical protein
VSTRRAPTPPTCAPQPSLLQLAHA